MLTTVLKDVFQDIDIYEDRFRFLQYPFDSPVSDAGIRFYKFYIMDTVYVERDKCFHLSFVPNNSQDFGFTGHLYILADSTYRVKKCQLNLPKKTDINFVDNMIIDQKFGELPTGEWTLLEDDMLCELSYLKKILGSYMVRRTTRYFDFACLIGFLFDCFVIAFTKPHRNHFCFVVGFGMYLSFVILGGSGCSRFSVCIYKQYACLSPQGIEYDIITPFPKN